MWSRGGARAVNYRHHSGKTVVDFRGTELMPEGSGHAMAESRTGRLEINMDLEHLQSPRTGCVRFRCAVGRRSRGLPAMAIKRSCEPDLVSTTSLVSCLPSASLFSRYFQRISLTSAVFSSLTDYRLNQIGGREPCLGLRRSRL